MAKKLIAVKLEPDLLERMAAWVKWSGSDRTALITEAVERFLSGERRPAAKLDPELVAELGHHGPRDRDRSPIVDVTTPNPINRDRPGPMRVADPLTTGKARVVEGLPIGHRERVMGKDGKSGAPALKGWNVLQGYEGDKPVWKFEERKP